MQRLPGAVLAALLFASAAAHATPVPLESHAKADGGSFAVGTLAALGSFEYQTAPAYTRLIMARRNATTAISKGRITVETAESVQSAADTVRKLLDSSLAVCKQNDKTGKCTGNSAKATKLLTAAEAALDTPPLSQFVPNDLRKGHTSAK